MSRLMASLWLALLLVAAAPTRAAAAPVVLVFGDSLSAGYGLHPGQGWVSLLERRLVTEGYEFRIVNASVSGETTEGGLARLPRALELHRPAVLVLELGANDGLRGLPPAATRANLERMVRLAQARHVRVLLLGIRMPPNYGPRYTSEFDALYREVAARRRVPLVPFLLDGVATERALMQADGLHPNERGQPRLLENVWPRLRALLGGMPAHGPAG